MHEAECSIENLAWSNDHVINSCGEPIKNKILEGLVGVSALELGGALVLKLMLDIITTNEDSGLRTFAQSFHAFWLKDVPGENVRTAVSYLK